MCCADAQRTQVPQSKTDEPAVDGLPTTATSAILKAPAVASLLTKQSVGAEAAPRERRLQSAPVFHDTLLASRIAKLRFVAPAA
jgi:hypothetical protein